MLIKRAGLADLDDVAPIFDAYRQFYGQRPDVAAALAFLGERLRRDESVIFLNDLFVRPHVRRGGIGRGLLERARFTIPAAGGETTSSSTISCSYEPWRHEGAECDP